MYSAPRLHVSKHTTHFPAETTQQHALEMMGWVNSIMCCIPYQQSASSNHHHVLRLHMGSEAQSRFFLACILQHLQVRIFFFIQKTDKFFDHDRSTMKCDMFCLLCIRSWFCSEVIITLIYTHKYAIHNHTSHTFNLN